MKLYSITFFNRATESIYTGLTAGFKQLIEDVKTTIAEDSPEEATEFEIKQHQKRAKKYLKESKDQFDSGFTYNTSPNNYICIQELTHLDITRANKVFKHNQLKEELKKLQADIISKI